MICNPTISGAYTDGSRYTLTIHQHKSQTNSRKAALLSGGVWAPGQMAGGSIWVQQPPEPPLSCIVAGKLVMGQFGG